jgi:Flp pilus assembly protein protease CpaA
MGFIIPIEIIKFSLGLFFLIILSYYDILEGKIPNKILFFMLLVGLIFLYFEREYLFKELFTFFVTFIFSYLLWEFSLLTPGDVKVLSILSFYLPYSTGINPYLSFSFFILATLSIYSLYLIIKKYNRKILKKVLLDYIDYLKKIDYINLFLFLFLVIQISYILGLSTLEILLIVLLLIFVIDSIIKYLNLELKLFLVILNLTIFYYILNFRNPDFLQLISTFVFSFVFFITLRIIFIILFFYLSTTEKKVEELKLGDKLAYLPVKIGNNDFVYPLRYNLLISKLLKNNLLFNYEPSLGLEKRNINKIKRFLKRKGFLKVKVFEEIPFVPFLLFSYIMFYFYYFYTFFF